MSRMRPERDDESGGAGSLPKLCEPELENMRIEAETAALIEEAVRGRPRRVAGGDPLQVMPHLCTLRQLAVPAGAIVHEFFVQQT